MTDKELQTLLEQLQAEIKNTQAVDEKEGKLLLTLEGDIAALLERSGESTTLVKPANVQTLEDSLDYFEVTHPSLTELISKLLEALSNAGI